MIKKRRMHTLKLSYRLIVILFCLLNLAACSIQERPSKEFAQRASDSTLHALEKKYGIISNAHFELFFERIVKRLSDSVETLRQHSLDAPLNNDFIPYTWNIHLINDSSINAFALGGGHIAVTKMLFTQSPSEAAFVSVIAHEMAHELLGHTNEALTLAMSNSNQTNTHYSLAQELAADELGVELLSIARYNTQHALDALTLGYRVSNEVVAGAPPDWLTIRSAKLYNLVLSKFMLSPATENSREFTGLQRSLRKGLVR